MQEVGPPHGRETERRLGGLQSWGRRNQRNAQDHQQTAPKERLRTRVRARARPGTPSPHPDFPTTPIPLLWGALWPPTDAFTVKTFQMIFSLYHPTQLMILIPHPVTKTYFPLTTPPTLTQTPPCAPSLILDHPPSLFP